MYLDGSFSSSSKAAAKFAFLGLAGSPEAAAASAAAAALALFASSFYLAFSSFSLYFLRFFNSLLPENDDKQNSHGSLYWRVQFMSYLLFRDHLASCLIQNKIGSVFSGCSLSSSSSRLCLFCGGLLSGRGLLSRCFIVSFSHSKFVFEFGFLFL